MLYEPVRIGIIGCDGYATELIRRLLVIPESGVITAAVSTDLNTPGAVFLRNRGIPVFSDIDEFLAAETFEVVINATPIHLHAPFTRQCLESGHDVWLEKPPTATIQDLDGLVETAGRAGRRVAVCFNWLHTHVIQALQQELVDGRFGTVRRVRSVGCWVRDEAYFVRNGWSGRVQTDGAWVLDGSINNPFAHVVCNGLFFAAPDRYCLAEPASVQAELYHANEIESEDTSSVRVVTREGLEVLTQLTLAPETEIVPTTVVETDEAVIAQIDFVKIHIQWRDNRIEVRDCTRETRVEMLQHLCRAFRTGEPYRCDIEMCRPFTKTVNGCFDSSAEVRTIPGSHIVRRPHGESHAVAVRDLHRQLQEAHQAGALLSEIGVPWAVAGKVQSLDDYAHFPTRFAGAVGPRR